MELMEKDMEEELFDVEDYERRAAEILPKGCLSYYSFKKERGRCYNDSIAAFSRYRIRGRNLHDVSERFLSTTLLGDRVEYPIGIAPTGWHIAAHPDAEKETARGAAKAQALYIMSVVSSSTIADVAAAAPGCLKWMQMYPFVDRLLTQHIIQEAERAGFKALVITVDSPCAGGKQTLTDGVKYCARNLELDIPSFRSFKESGKKNYNKDYRLAMMFNKKATWDDVKWVKSNTSLPIVCKGILTAESAKEAANAGVSGIIVSAHGGRQSDAAPAPIDALAEVVEAVRDRGIEVYLDGGMRTGSDVFKALGRGARAVFLGRPILWGLACQGANGVANILEILKSELEAVFDVSGCTSPDSIPPDMVVHESYYHQSSFRASSY